MVILGDLTEFSIKSFIDGAPGDYWVMTEINESFQELFELGSKWTCTLLIISVTYLEYDSDSQGWYRILWD